METIYIKIAKILEISKQTINTNDYDTSAKTLLLCMNALQKTKDIRDVLELEAICLDIFDRNTINNNINKVDARLVSCQMALDEYTYQKNITIQKNKEKNKI